MPLKEYTLSQVAIDTIKAYKAAISHITHDVLSDFYSPKCVNFKNHNYKMLRQFQIFIFQR